jgi:hypothetical protein
MVSEMRAAARAGATLAIVIGFAGPQMTTVAVASPPSPNAPTAAPTRTYQLPTATEVFHLRAECEKLGEKILHEDFHGPALTISQISSYNPKTNRCHVTLTTQHSDLSQSGLFLHVTLYDGQTKEILAFYKIDNNGEKSGLGFKNGEVGFDASKDYIDGMMKDE